MAHRTPGAISLLAALALTLTGCSAGAAPGSGPQAVAAPAVASPAAALRPIDKAMPDTDRLVALAHTTADSINACLAQQGYPDRWIYPPDPVLRSYLDGAIRDRTVRSNLWGFFDPDHAGTWGYHRDPLETASELTITPVSEQALSVCGFEALQVPDPLLLTLEGALPEGGPTLVTDDPRFRATVSQWSTCMARHGHRYPSPMEALTEFAPEAAPSDRERAVATADIACKQETNLVGIGLALQTPVDEAYVATHRNQLAAYRGD